MVLASFPLFLGWDSFNSEGEEFNSDVSDDHHGPMDVDNKAGGSRVDALDETKN